MAKVRRFLKKSGDDRNYIYNYSKSLVEKGGFVECDAHGTILTMASNPVTDAPRATGIAGPNQPAAAPENNEIAELRAQVQQMMAMIQGMAASPATIIAPPAATEKTQDPLNNTVVSSPAPVDFEEMTKAEIVDLAKARFGEDAEHMKDYMPKATLIENFGLLEAAAGVPAPTEEGAE